MVLGQLLGIFFIHHKNVERWLKGEEDHVKITRRSKRQNKKGQGQKVSYPQHIDEELYQWIIEKGEVNNVPISSAYIKLKALAILDGKG